MPRERARRSAKEGTASDEVEEEEEAVAGLVGEACVDEAVEEEPPDGMRSIRLAPEDADEEEADADCGDFGS